MNETETRRSKVKKKHPVRKAILMLILILVLAIAGVAGYLYFKTNSTVSKINAPLKTSATNIADKKPFAVLLLGTDNDLDSKGRQRQGLSDTMILAVVNPQKEKTYLLSLPRDTRVPIVGHGTEEKINSAFAYGGAQMAVDTVSEFMDIPVNYYVNMNMDGFKQLVDAVDGVTVNNKLNFKQDGITFNTGNINLSGKEALAYSRMRYEDPKGDFGRQQRQRQVIEAVTRKATSSSVVFNYNDILKAIGDNVETNLDTKDMISIAKNYRGVVNNVTESSIEDGTGETLMNPDGATTSWYYVVSDDVKAKYQKELKEALAE
ncbi:hypothetical protein BFC19_07105 [Brochothrix thermosphacta]|uniref:LCP family glycopolymer transferase n=1 Tax=Brochothrix thermosphacta TaxID=2756 RepID=UPI000E71894A|nr:LCP family protein [Brochothrix thermosphacta]ANZ95157.1 hypothetical protein BFC19_07105 [Brochothrix thermosphacta]